MSVLWASAAALSWLCGAYAGSPSDSLSALISNNKSLSKPELPLGLQPGKPVAVGGGEAVGVDVDGDPPNAVSEGVGVRLGVGVVEGVNVTVGVDVMVEVGVRVSGRNRVADGPNVGVALGNGEGRAGVPEESGRPRGAAVPDPLGSESVLSTNEPMGPNRSRSNMLGRTAALDA